MSTSTTTAAAFAATSPLLRRHASPHQLCSLLPPLPRLPPRHVNIKCQVAVTRDASPSGSDSPSEDEEATAAAAKIGKRVRVNGPLRIYHVTKAPELDLNGMEGVIKQFVGVWKGKRITANLPFKVEFVMNVDGQEKPVKFSAHLREEEFELVD